MVNGEWGEPFVYSPFTIYHSRTGHDLARADVVPGLDGGQRAVVCHVAPERRDGDVAVLYGLVVCAVGRVPGEVLLADPVVGLAARVYVLADDGASVLQ